MLSSGGADSRSPGKHIPWHGSGILNCFANMAVLLIDVEEKFKNNLQRFPSMKNSESIFFTIFSVFIILC